MTIVCSLSFKVTDTVTQFNCDLKLLDKFKTLYKKHTKIHTIQKTVDDKINTSLWLIPVIVLDVGLSLSCTHSKIMQPLKKEKEKEMNTYTIRSVITKNPSFTVICILKVLNFVKTFNPLLYISS